MLFDLEPKSKREDLYDFEEQLNDLLAMLKGRRASAPMIRVVAPRRLGKTSLVLTALSETEFPHLVLDGRVFAEASVVSKEEFLVTMERWLNSAVKEQEKLRNAFLSVLRGVRWIKVNSTPPFLHFEWEKPQEDASVADLFFCMNTIGGKCGKFILVLDEAQEFRKIVGPKYWLQKLIAHAYDRMRGIQMVVTGSEIGLLYDFLGVEDPKNPLFGRGMMEIYSPRLSREMAIDFLRKGFEQAGIPPAVEQLEKAARELNGIMGWLTLFGAISARKGGPSEKTLLETIRAASALVRSELGRFLAKKRNRENYLAILECTSTLGGASWSDLKRFLAHRLGKKVADKVFSACIHELLAVYFLEKREDGTYVIPDPILSRITRKK